MERQHNYVYQCVNFLSNLKTLVVDQWIVIIIYNHVFTHSNVFVVVQLYGWSGNTATITITILLTTRDIDILTPPLNGNVGVYYVTLGLATT